MKCTVTALLALPRGRKLERRTAGAPSQDSHRRMRVTLRRECTATSARAARFTWWLVSLGKINFPVRRNSALQCESQTIDAALQRGVGWSGLFNGTSHQLHLILNCIVLHH